MEGHNCSLIMAFSTESVATPSARWSHQEVLTLIDLWVKQQEQLKAAGRLKKSVYQQIEREMKDCGFPNKDWEQCRNKIRSLTRDYRTKGNEFIYYKEMDRVLQGRTPSVLPDSPNIEVNTYRGGSTGGQGGGAAAPPPPTLGYNTQGCLRVHYSLYSVTVCTGESHIITSILDPPT